MRYIIETSTPGRLDKDKRWTDVMGSLKQQQTVFEHDAIGVRRRIMQESALENQSKLQHSFVSITIFDFFTRTSICKEVVDYSNKTGYDCIEVLRDRVREGEPRAQGSHANHESLEPEYAFQYRTPHQSNLHEHGQWAEGDGAKAPIEYRR